MGESVYSPDEKATLHNHHGGVVCASRICYQR